jgi:hypothetical protein
MQPVGWDIFRKVKSFLGFVSSFLLLFFTFEEYHTFFSSPFLLACFDCTFWRFPSRDRPQASPVCDALADTPHQSFSWVWMPRVAKSHEEPVRRRQPVASLAESQSRNGPRAAVLLLLASS